MLLAPALRIGSEAAYQLTSLSTKRPKVPKVVHSMLRMYVEFIHTLAYNYKHNFKYGRRAMDFTFASDKA